MCPVGIETDLRRENHSAAADSERPALRFAPVRVPAVLTAQRRGGPDPLSPGATILFAGVVQMWVWWIYRV